MHPCVTEMTSFGISVKEGLAQIFLPESNAVFFNPVQEFNRDLTILAVQTFVERSCAKGRPVDHSGLRILDALSASGLRAVRYSKEIQGALTVTAVDSSKSALQQIQLNVELNEVTSKVECVLSDSINYMSKMKSSFDVIDLDPYGTATPFLESAFNSIKDGGLLCITCTDAAVWASTGYAEKCFALYGGIPLKGENGQEAGIRLLLHAIASCAARRGMYIEPLLSLQIDFYARMFITVSKDPSAVKTNASKTAFVFTCEQGCGSWLETNLMETNYLVSDSGKSSVRFVRSKAPPGVGKCLHCSATRTV